VKGRQRAFQTLCLAILLAGALAGGMSGAELPAGASILDTPDPGLRLYREGLLPSGQPLQAELPGGVRLPGASAACASCHRRSGFGSAEGGTVVPPITGPALFGDGRRRTDLFRPLFQEELSPAAWARVRKLTERPAYTEESLARALREGQDPTGRPLDPLMPRYALSDQDIGHLAAYLHTLAATPDPGVDDQAIHLATIVTPGADPSQRSAVTDVLEAYLRWKNADVERRRLMPDPPHGEEEAYGLGRRTWTLHTWELTGPPATWGAQLAERYRRQPIFALLGGQGPGAWQPIHAFCEEAQVPCIFPLTDLPVTTPPGAYALYLSGGLPAEAEALARHLRETSQNRKIVQIYRDDDTGRAAAGLLRQALADAGGIQLLDRPLPPGRATTAKDFLLTRKIGGKPAALILWLPASDLLGLPQRPRKAPDLYLSSTFLRGTLPVIPASWQARTRIAWLFNRPEANPPQAYRTRAWLRARGITPRHDALQLATHTTLSLIDSALSHLGDRFSRDLFVETLEREAERTPNPGPYPRLSLGPGQRVAARGCEVVALETLTPWPPLPQSGRGGT
jgi:cytochrome c553